MPISPPMRGLNRRFSATLAVGAVARAPGEQAPSGR
jgi:hypothetical protein